VYAGKAGEGGRFLAQGSVGLSRPDVGAATGNAYWTASGFDAIVPAGTLPAGPASLTVYAHSPSKGWWYQPIDVQIAPTAPGLNLMLLVPGHNEIVPPTTEWTIRGTAYDTRTTAEQRVGVDRVQVYLDGERGIAGSQFLGEAYPSAQTLWAVTFSPTRYDSVPHHVVYVYARSAVTGQEQLLTREFTISNRTPD
jgi:hypothetical protein